jgi:hypothetical protein
VNPNWNEAAIKEVLRVSELVKDTQPIWSGHLRIVGQLALAAAPSAPERRSQRPIDQVYPWTLDRRKPNAAPPITTPSGNAGHYDFGSRR